MVAARPNNDSLKTSYKTEVEVSVANGFFDIKQTNSYGLYESSGQQYSYGLSCERALSKLFWSQLSFYYTEDDYNLQIYYPNGIYAEPPVMTKTLGVLDIGAFVGLNIPDLNKFVPYFFVGFFISPLLKGKDYLDGIYSHVQPYQIKGASHQFNSTSSSMVGIGVKYYFAKHFGVDLQLDHRQFGDENGIVADNSIKNPAFNFVGGISYRF